MSLASGNYHIAIGAGAMATADGSQDNIGVGHYALYKVTSNDNVGIGNQSLYNATGITYNEAIGSYSGYGNVDGSSNVFIGDQAGYGAGSTYTGSSDNTIIGSRAGYSLASSQTGSVFLGHEAGYNETGSNKLYIENSNSSSPLIWGDFSSNILNFNANVGIGITAPAARLAATLGTSGDTTTVRFNTTSNGFFQPTSTIKAKENVTDLTFDKEKYLSLRPVDFTWKSGLGGGLGKGLIAEEVLNYMPDMVEYGPKHVWDENGNWMKDSEGNVIVDPTQR